MMYFKLANTQFQRALKIFVIDGFVTEHVKISQSISKLYKQLIAVEDQAERVTAMLNERAALLEPLCEMLSENAYYNLLQEMAAELSEIYGHKFDLIYEPLTNG